MRVLAILTVKNEGAFLLEWLAHHRATGFTDFLIFSNDCDDGTDVMLDRLQAMGWITHVRNDGPHEEGPQWSALKAAEKHPLRRSADWILVLDVDEFVNIHVGDRTLGALFATLQVATAIPLTWRFFGNSGIIDFVDQSVKQSFSKAAPARFGWPWRAQLFKTLFRNDDSYKKLGVHRPKSPVAERIDQQRWYDGSGRIMPASFHTQGIFSDYSKDNYALVQLNHYALGSAEGFVIKADRGRANRDASSFDMGYWVERNFNEVEDTSILRLDCAGFVDELHSDSELSQLHAQAVAWRKMRFHILMQQEPWRAFFGRLLMAGPSHTLSPAQARLILRHLT